MESSGICSRNLPKMMALRLPVALLLLVLGAVEGFQPLPAVLGRGGVGGLRSTTDFDVPVIEKSEDFPDKDKNNSRKFNWNKQVCTRLTGPTAVGPSYGSSGPRPPYGIVLTSRTPLTSRRSLRNQRGHCPQSARFLHDCCLAEHSVQLAL